MKNETSVVEQLQTLSTVYQRLASVANQANTSPNDKEVLALLLAKIKELTTKISGVELIDNTTTTLVYDGAKKEVSCGGHTIDFLLW